MLHPCRACYRHVDIVQSICPFCGADRAADDVPRTAPHVSALGRLGRAAVFAGAVLASPAGCAGGSQLHYEQLPPPPPDQPVPHAGVVRGQVARHDGKPATYRTVTLYGGALRGKAGADRFSVSTDPRGRFVFDAVPPGNYVVRTPGGDEVELVVRPGQAAVLHIELDKPKRPDSRHMAKPYGAPPARRRIV